MIRGVLFTISVFIAGLSIVVYRMVPDYPNGVELTNADKVTNAMVVGLGRLCMALEHYGFVGNLTL